MNISGLNEFRTAEVNAGYGARGVPAFLCHFVSED
jgi:hypothetical protein